MPNLLGKTHSFTSCTISSLQIILACQNAFPHVCAHLMPKGEKNMNLLADRVYKSELEAQLSPVSCKRNRTTLDFFPNFCFFLFFCFFVKLNTGDELCGSVCSLFFCPHVLMASAGFPQTDTQTAGVYNDSKKRTGLNAASVHRCCCFYEAWRHSVCRLR